MPILSFLQFRGARRAEKLYKEARELVDDGFPEEALAIARKLRKLRHSGAFEIEGLAYSALDRKEDAVRVLREGLATAPGVWPNWMLLGSCLSNLERFDEAMLAYDRAAACDGAIRDTIDLNRAIVAVRQRQYDAALRYLDNVHSHQDSEMRLRAISVRVDALQSLSRDSEAEDLGSRTLNAWRDSNATDGAADIAQIADMVGEIRAQRGGDRETIRAELIEWWRATQRKMLLWRIRDLRMDRSPDAQYFRVKLHGTVLPEAREALDAEGFVAGFDAVADTVEEAVAFYTELYPLESGVELRVDEADALAARPDDVKGVYHLSGRIYYETTS